MAEVLLKQLEHLKSSGFNEKQATGILSVIRSNIDNVLATKKDIIDVRKDIEQLRVATKKDIIDVRKDIEQLRADTQKDIAQLRADTQKDIAQLRTDTQKDIADVRKDIEQLRADTQKDIAGVRKDIEASKQALTAQMMKMSMVIIGVLASFVTLMKFF